MRKKVTAVFLSFVSLFLFAVPAFAHVIVSPNQVGVATIQDFSMAVPAEDGDTTAVKLRIPIGLKMVTPNVKQGWTITEKTSGTGDGAPVTEIDWSGGTVPKGQRDTFIFQAQVPSKETVLQWKAYQTYADGKVVAWDNPPSKNPEDDSEPPPYSTTKIINDLPDNTNMEKHDTGAYILGGLAFIMSAVSFWRLFQKK